MRILTAAALLAMLATLTYADDKMLETEGAFAGSYLCVPEAAAGLYLDEASKDWKGAGFNAALDKGFVIALKPFMKATSDEFGVPEEAMSYRVETKFLGDDTVDYCSGNGPVIGTAFVSVYGVFECDRGFHEYRINLKSLRFISYYSYGYVLGEDDGEDTPSLTIGKCHRL